MLKDLEELSASEHEKDLKEIFPQPSRIILRRSLVWILVYILFAWGVFFSLSDVAPNRNQLSQFTYLFGFYLIAIGAIVCIGKVIYEIAYHNLYLYKIEDGNLIVSEGIFLKERGMYPISAIRDVYLERNFLDLVFGLYNLHITNLSSESHHFGDIKGLAPEDAVGFQNYLKELIIIVRPDNRKAEKVDPEEYKAS